MGDGYLNKCKECAKKDVREREAELRKDPAWVWKERERGRNKFKRLYRKSLKPYKQMTRCNNSYADRYPEKYLAKNSSARLKPPRNGLVKHHWSYNKTHWKDVVWLTAEEHYFIHRYLVYDQERMMYRTINGVLLDSKEVSEKYYEHCKKNPNPF